MKSALMLWLAAGAMAMGQETQETIPRAPLVVEGPEAATSGEAVSRSMQFRVTGGDGAVRGSVAILAEQTKDELLRLTEENDDWKVPVRIMLFGKQGDPSPPRSIAMELFYNDAGYDLRVKVHLGHGIENERFATAVTSALIYERTLRARKPEESETAFSVPPWLVAGLREATAWRLKESDRRTYETLFKRGGVFKMDQLFAIDDAAYENLDAATRVAFRVSSGALVMALLEQPQGKEGFRSFLSAVAGFQGEMPVLLRRHFPELNLSETSLAKWWALQLANKGTAPLTDSLSIAETEASLNEVLRLHFRSAEGNAQEKPLSAWQELAAMKEAERAEAVRPAQDGLVRLSYRSFPSYRPVLTEYQTVLTSLGRGKTDKVAAQLAELEQSRGLMRAKADRARDFLDWFEITRARQTSGEFDDYLRLKDRLEYQSHHREDEMSKYLDKMDAIFNRGQEAPKAQPNPQLLLLPQ
jgi:hypothetical protein